MEVSQTGLALFAFASLLLGFLLGAFYDISAILPALGGRIFSERILKRLENVNLPIIKRRYELKKTPIKDFTVGFSLFLHDLVFMLFAGIATALLVYRFNDGRWRFYVPLFLFIGFAAYRKFFRIPVLALAEILRFIIKCAFAYVLCLAFAPIKWILGALKRFVMRFYEVSRTRRLKKLISEYTEKEKIRLTALASDNGCLSNIKGDQNDRFEEKNQQNNIMDDDTAVRCVGHCCVR